MATSNSYHYPDGNDSGLWKIIMSVSPKEIIAVMKNTADKTVRPKIMFRTEIEGNEHEMLRRLESAVYDHPAIMDDYAIEIIVTTPKALWVPSDMIEDEETEEAYLTRIYPCDADDMMTNSNEEETCLFTFIAGLPSFINRTLPGCRIYSHQFILHRELQGKPTEFPRVYVNVREDDFDLLAYGEGKLLSVSTHDWEDTADISYYVFLLADAYQIDPKRMEIFVAGKNEPKSKLVEALKEMTGHVYQLKESEEYSEMGLPFEMTLAIDR